MAGIGIDMRDKLKQLAELERKHDIRGITFTVAEGCKPPTPAESVDFCISLIKQGAEAMRNRLSIPITQHGE